LVDLEFAILIAFLRSPEAHHFISSIVQHTLVVHLVVVLSIVLQLEHHLVEFVHLALEHELSELVIALAMDDP
jgi:hypothetical protein